MSEESRHEFELSVTRGLTSVTTQLEALTEQVRRQNGNVAKLWEHMNAVEKHPATCPLNERVTALELTEATERAKLDAEAKAAATIRAVEAQASKEKTAALDRQAEQYFRWIRPVLPYAALTAGVLVVDHWGDILHALSLTHH